MFFTDFKILKLILILSIFILTNGCKKEKSDSYYESLIGTYDWQYTAGGWGGQGWSPNTTNYSLKLQILKEGKYKLFQNQIKIGHGRLIGDAYGYLAFKNDNLIGSDILNGLRILKLRGGDSLDIGVSYCCDTFVSLYVKQ